MAKKKRKTNKSALIRDYLDLYPDKMPAEIAKQIWEDKKVRVTAKFVSTVKVSHKPGSAAGAPKAAAKTKGKAAPAKAKAAAATSQQLSQHIANLKAAVSLLGKDESKRIIDLF